MPGPHEPEAGRAARTRGRRAAEGATTAPAPAPVDEATAPAPAPATPPAGTDTTTDAARQRLALAQAALLSALVAGTPAPEGFDRARLRVQSRALTAKRADVVAKVAPELPGILGTDYRAAFLGYARHRPVSDGYRRDALEFAAYLLDRGRPEDPDARRQLRRWWTERAGPRPPSARPLARLVRAVRQALPPR